MRGFFICTMSLWFYVAKGAKMPTTESQVKHIFDKSKVNDGHIAPTTNASQNRAGKMFENVTANARNKRPDLVTNPHKQKAGIVVFTKNQNNGQVWVETRKGLIQDAGVNRQGNFK